MASCCSQRGLHPTGACILNLLPWWTGGALLQRMLKGDSPGDNPTPDRDPALCKGNHWRSKCPHHQIEDEVPPPMD
jgi:hypothetical protein